MERFKPPASQQSADCEGTRRTPDRGRRARPLYSGWPFHWRFAHKGLRGETSRKGGWPDLHRFRSSENVGQDASRTQAPDGGGVQANWVLLVLSHDPAKRDPEIPADLQWRTEQIAGQLQEQITQLSSHGRRVVVTGAGHDIYRDRPDVVILHARTMVENIRKHQ